MDRVIGIDLVLLGSCNIKISIKSGFAYLSVYYHVPDPELRYIFEALMELRKRKWPTMCARVCLI